jgi:hypothetical protein
MTEHDERFLAALGDSTLADELSAPSRLKALIFSALNLAQAKSGPLLPLGDCKAAGSRLCVFEELVRIAPLGRTVQSMNCCRACHARVLAESIENAPIWWPGCPYVGFQNR